MKENRYEGVSNWLRSQEGVSNDIVYRDMALQDKLEQKRRQTCFRPEIQSDRPYRPEKWYSIGKGRSSGNIQECGRFLELWLSPEFFHVGNGTSGAKSAKECRTPLDREKVALRTNHRARKQIRRIVNANDFRGMITLTLALPSAENDKLYATHTTEQQRDYKLVRKLYKQAVQRACRHLRVKSYPYLVVFELHCSEKTSPEKLNTWHIHVAVNTDIEIVKAITETWWNGITNYQDYRYDKKGKLREEEISNPGAYISEYIGKDGAQFGEEKLINCRRYTTSRTTKRPKKSSIEELDFQGNFETITYKGKVYNNVYFQAVKVDGMSKTGATALYCEVKK